MNTPLQIRPGHMYQGNKQRRTALKDPRTAFRITLAFIIMAAIATIIFPARRVAQANTVREIVRVCKIEREAA